MPQIGPKPGLSEEGVDVAIDTDVSVLYDNSIPGISTTVVRDINNILGYREIQESYPEARMQNPLRFWLIDELRKQSFLWSDYRPSEKLILHAASGRLGPTANKALLFSGDAEHFNPDTATWFGGICLIYTGDGEKLKDKNEPLPFNSLESFRTWFTSWYPRMDQIHDTISIPPKGCKKAYYVVEDSIWARRIAQWGRARGVELDSTALATVLKESHIQNGKPAIEHWLRRHGYKGEIHIIFSGEIERELSFALRMFERQQGTRIKHADRDDYFVGLMGSTSILQDIVGAREGVIAVPMRYFSEMLRDTPFSTKGLYHLGYLPYYGKNGPTRLQSYENVPHRGNTNSFWSNGSADHISSQWAIANHFFSSEKPFSIALDNVSGYLQKEMAAIYGE